MLNVLTKYLANSLIYNSAVSTSPSIEFPSKIQYYYRNFFVMITKSTMTSGHLMYIPTFILGYSNAASMSHISKIHPYSSYYQVSTIRIIFEVYDAIGDNESVKSVPGTCIYPLTKFLDFWKNNPSWSSLILNTHLKYLLCNPKSHATLVYMCGTAGSARRGGRGGPLGGVEASLALYVFLIGRTG